MSNPDLYLIVNDKRGDMSYHVPFLVYKEINIWLI